jgi:hypothetical protein
MQRAERMCELPVHARDLAAVSFEPEGRRPCAP